MSDLDLESNVDDRDNYDLNKFEDFSQNPGKFDNLIGDSPASAKGKLTSKGSSTSKEEGFAIDEQDEDNEQCYDEDEQSQDIRSYMNKYKNKREEESKKQRLHKNGESNARSPKKKKTIKHDLKDR